MGRWLKVVAGLALLLLPVSPAWAEPDMVVERLVAFNGLILFAVLAIVLVALVLVLVTLVLLLLTVWKSWSRTEK